MSKSDPALHRSSSSSSSSQDRHWAQTSELERQLRAYKRDNAAMKLKLSTTIVLEEKLQTPNQEKEKFMKLKKDMNVIVSERNMLREEKRNWNLNFYELLQQCRAMDGESSLAQNSAFSSSSSSSSSSSQLESCTVPAVLHLLRRFQKKEALALEQRGQLERR